MAFHRIKAGLIAASLMMPFSLAAAQANQADQVTVAPESNATSDGMRIDACANDPTRLGLSRVVEIDTNGGPSFGGAHLDFLKDHEVILTFDDGPVRRHTQVVLEALAEHCTKATFFMVGRMAANDPEMVRTVAAAGHTVGAHTWSHLNQRALSPVRGVREVELGISAVSKALGKPVAPFFRFPYLSDNRRSSDYVKSRDLAVWWVDIDSKDYQTRNAKRARDRVMAQLNVRKKGIILMHDIQPSTVGAIHGLLDDLHAQGYKVVHIVPKNTGTTIAEFDAEAEKIFDKSKKSKVAEPASEAKPANSGASRAAKSVKKSKARTASARKSDGGNLPWKPSTFGY